MRIAELTASAARFAEEFAASSKARHRQPREAFFFAHRLLAVSRLNVARGRKPVSLWARSKNMGPPLPKHRIGAKRQRPGAVLGLRVLQRSKSNTRAAIAPASAEIIVLRPERSHFADFETRLARARGKA